MTWLSDYLDGRNDDWQPPANACRREITRTCPRSYEGVCGDRPCARFESKDEAPWQADLEHDRALGLWLRYGVPDVADPEMKAMYAATERLRSMEES